MTKLGWLDCSSGVSGDMLLGALYDVGALDALPALLESLDGLGASMEAREVKTGGVRAVRMTVTAADRQPHRRLADIRSIIGSAAVPEAVAARAVAVFDRLASAEATVHGTTADEVEFHEVGAVDSIVDVLGCCLGLHALGLDRLVVSPVALGGGTVTTAHGELPVPTPAALELLAGSALVAAGGAAAVELATPTGLALLAEWADDTGPMPASRVERTGVGAGSREPAGQPNVVRLVIGEADVSTPADEQWVVIEANVDDLDPRLWPGVLAALLSAGAADAWLTPILMKKGRPAHTVSALGTATTMAAVQRVLFAETSTIGARWYPVAKTALDRTTVSVDIDGLQVRVKVAFADGVAVSATPEFDDIAAAAAALGAPTKDVLAAAVAAARNALSGT
jgi:uncharacterized protein (TIGR00299 family) protein